MSDKKEKEYICAYGKYCLHHGEKVKSSEAVMINKRYYHWDCAGMKQEIRDCVDTYMECIEDKSQFPVAYRAMNTMVFKNKTPVDFIKSNINKSKLYYSTKPVQVLYGLRKLFYEKNFKA